MRTLLFDLRHALRILTQKPGFSGIVVLTLALGIGANTSIFSVVNAVLLQPLPYKDPEHLVAVFTHEVDRGEFRNPSSPANFIDWKTQTQVFENMTAAYPWSATLTDRDEPAQLSGLKVSASLFELLGVQVELGRTFPLEQGEVRDHQVIVLGHDLWQNRFGGDPGIIGQTLTLSNQVYQVIGIMPHSFQFPPFWATDAQFWVPLVFSPEEAGRRESSYLRVFARLKPGITLFRARAEMDLIAQRLQQQYPEANTGIAINVEPLQEPVVSGIRPALLILFGAIGLVALIACANVASLLLVRALGRRKEVAVREALGASRRRLFQQLLTEGMVLALAGGLAGLLLASWAVGILTDLVPAEVPRINQFGLDLHVLAYTLGLCLLTGLIFGLAPALQIRKSGPYELIKEEGRQSGSAGKRRLHGALVVAEIALAMVLLIGASLLVQSFFRLQKLDPGFRQDNILTATLSLAASEYGEPDRQVIFFRELLDQISSLPGVQNAGLINHLPIGGDIWQLTFGIEGDLDRSPESEPRASFRVISPGYFSTIGIPLIRGRGFDARDTAESPRIVIINQTLAGRFWPNQDPLGQRIRIGGAESGEHWLTVVGIVGDVRQVHLADEIRPEVYFPYPQSTVPWYKATTLVVNTSSHPQALVHAVQDQVWKIDRSVPISNIRTMRQILSEELSQERFNTLLLGAFAMVALIMASLGVYGVVSYSVSQRTQEIGIRMAVGARPRDILRLLARQGGTLILAGVAIGLASALALTRFLTSLLFGVSATDSLTFVGASVLIAVVALLACYIPARRATKVDPVVVLK